MFGSFAYGQSDDLLKQIDSTSTDNSAAYGNAFKTLQIVQGQSTKLPAKHEFYLSFNHRFSSVKGGIDELFGLDAATMKLNFVYGLEDWLSLGVSRSTYNKTYELAAKYRLFVQSENIPVTIVGNNVVSVNTLISKDDYPDMKFGNRLAYTSQVLISRKFDDNFSLQLSPTYIHKNTKLTGQENANQAALGAGGRYKLSKRISLNAEYYYNFNKPSGTQFVNPLSLGMDIDTGGHIFQLIFTNSQPSTEAGYITNGSGDWAKGNFYFGFNLYRVF